MKMKKTMTLFVALMLAMTSAYADPAFTDKEIPVNRGREDGGTVTLRFYEDMPTVPYISVAVFQQLMLPGTTITVAKDGEGAYTLTGPYAKATVNTTTEQFSSDNFMAFTNLMGLVQEGMDKVYIDGSPYIRYKSQELTPASATVTFDFKKYDIDLRGDDEAVYFPFTTLADLYSDLYYHFAAYNGEKVIVVTDHDDTNICTMESARTKELLNQTTRPADMAAFCYKELCFLIDYFYGMPGRSSLEGAIKKDGLDKALDTADYGADIKKMLKSTNMTEYLFGMNCLQLLLYDRGHTYLNIDLLAYLKLETSVGDAISAWLGGVSSLKEVYPELWENFIHYFAMMMASQKENVSKAREDRGIDGYYYKEGDTAYLLLPAFGDTNYAAWRAYYAGGCTGSTPAVDEDYPGDLSVVLDAMKRANDDPEVKNLIIDIAANSGGSLDVVMAMTALMAGQTHFYSENVLTGQRQLITYDVDCNFDGVFDEKDKEVWKNYNLKYGVLTSDVSFSCANLFPSLMKDLGFPIIGEKSGGGACAVQQFVTPEGLQFNMSSSLARLTDKNWQNIDPGIVPTNPIDVPSGDYSKFYDVAYVSDIMKTATSIDNIKHSTCNVQHGFYTLDGRRINGKPTAKGVYIYSGKKVSVTP